MVKKDLMKIIEKEINLKTQKQIKIVQNQFEKSYTDIKQYIENKLQNDTKFIKEEINLIKEINVSSILEDLKNQIEKALRKFNEINEQIKNVHKKVNKIKEIKKAVLQKLEEDTEIIKNEFNN